MSCCPTTTIKSPIYGATDRVSLTPLSRPLGADEQRGLKIQGPSSKLCLGAELSSPPWLSGGQQQQRFAQWVLGCVLHSLTFPTSQFPQSSPTFLRAQDQPRSLAIFNFEFGSWVFFGIGAFYGCERRLFVVGWVV